MRLTRWLLRCAAPMLLLAGTWTWIACDSRNSAPTSAPVPNAATNGSGTGLQDATNTLDPGEFLDFLMSEYPEAVDPKVFGEETGRFAASRIKALFDSPEEFQAAFEELLSDLVETREMSSEEREVMKRMVEAIAVGAFHPDQTGDDFSSVRKAIQNNFKAWEHTPDPTEVEMMRERILGPVKQRQLEMLRERGIEIPPDETPQPHGGPSLFGPVKRGEVASFVLAAPV